MGSSQDQLNTLHFTYMFTWCRHWLRRLGRPDNCIWLIAAASLTARIIYVFFFAAYRSHLTSDMRWYAERAIDFAAGNLTEPHQWLVWPPFYHMFLGTIFRLADLFGLHSARLATALTVQMILAAISVYLVYSIARHILQENSWALGVAAVYAFTYPLIYMNSFLLSENLAIPLLIFSVWLISVSKNKTDYFELQNSILPLSKGEREGVGNAEIVPHLTSSKIGGGVKNGHFRIQCGRLIGAGVTLALAIAVRPALLLLAVPFVIYLWQSKSLLRSRAIAIFAGTLVAGLVMASGYVAIISRGQVMGVGANGGINFLLRQCRIRELVVRDPRATIGLTPTQFTAPELSHLPALEVQRNLNDQKFFVQSGWACLRANGIGRLIRDFADLPHLWVGQFFPWFPAALGSRQLLHPWLWGVALGTLAAAALTWRRRLWSLAIGRELMFLWLLVGAVVLTGIPFPVEPRFMMPVWFAIYILLAVGIRDLVRQTRDEGTVAKFTF